jgi:predicted O-linked N-acetylglucosamine transferase (SPINDLY family)
MQQGNLDEAANCYEQALRLQPSSVAAYNNLGFALLKLGKLDEAVRSFRHAACLQPDMPEIHNNLGMALMNQGEVQEAVLSFRLALDLRPDMAAAHNNLGLALAAQGDPDGALACYERAVESNRDHAGALTNLGNAYKDQGRLGEAIVCYRRAMVQRPEDSAHHSNLLLAMNYKAGADPLEILHEARCYNEQHAASLAAVSLQPVRPLAGRRLRIGYVSGDFREHPAAYFLEPILASHNHGRFEVFCYSNVAQPDTVTQRLQRYVDEWRSLVGITDEQAAEVIRRDSIDILVDLAGHTGGNRLLIFARRPAPVQVSYLGYLGTTGLSTIDYYITDAHTDPPGLTETHFQEQLVRLPDSAFCYQPGLAPEVSAEWPARLAGGLTFGSLNTLAKLSMEVLTLWGRVLAAVPASRMALRSGAGHWVEDWVRNALALHGVVPERIVFLPRTASRFDYLKLYRGVDVCLDPFPYNGVTTTCDALWMGVPVVTLAGRTHVSRMGVRFLSSVGLDELITQAPEAYVQLATRLAGDLPRLTALRRGLRERMSRSPLMDAMQLTLHLEETYQAMWDQWLRTAESAPS